MSDIAPSVVAFKETTHPTIHTRATSDEQLVSSWLDGLHSPRTKANFATTAKRFLEALAASAVTMRSATVEDVRDAIGQLTVGMAPSSAMQYTMRVKSLLSYAHRLGYVTFNAGVVIRAGSGHVDRAKRIASETEIALLIRAAPTKRDKLLLQVGYAGGLRVSELVSLTWGDVLPRDDAGTSGARRVQLSVRGKGEHLRYVLLPELVSTALEVFVGPNKNPSMPVFASRNGGALDTRSINYMIKRAAARSGINPDISAHWLRHAHASHALNRGATIAEVKDTLGHANVSTTSVYLHARPDRSSGLVLDEGIFR